jgi:glycosyltransferase involved in cell wall biosynthesis
VINLVSTQAWATRVTGPQKVFANLVKGLDLIGYPYVVNRRLDGCARLWIHDDTAALASLPMAGVRPVLGPNLFVMPQDVPTSLDLRDSLYLHPCPWATDLWRTAGFTACPLTSWPVGVDLRDFQPSVGWRRPGHVLVYHKHRDPAELVAVLEAIRSAGLTCDVLRYGHYDETGFKAALAVASFVVWHGRHESQGLALEETLASGVPILLCDVTSLSQSTDPYGFPADWYDFPVTAAPYWDDSCGVRITRLADLPMALGAMQDRLESFRPREFVERTLSLEKQAREFVALWEHFGLTVEDGRGERVLRRGRWSSPSRRTLRRRVVSRLDRVLRTPR